MRGRTVEDAICDVFVVVVEEVGKKDAAEAEYWTGLPVVLRRRASATRRTIAGYYVSTLRCN